MKPQNKKLYITAWLIVHSMEPGAFMNGRQALSRDLASATVAGVHYWDNGGSKGLKTHPIHQRPQYDTSSESKPPPLSFFNFRNLTKLKTNSPDCGPDKTEPQKSLTYKSNTFEKRSNWQDPQSCAVLALWNWSEIFLLIYKMRIICFLKFFRDCYIKSEINKKIYYC